jgi:predicted membrane protein
MADGFSNIVEFGDHLVNEEKLNKLNKILIFLSIIVGGVLLFIYGGKALFTSAAGIFTVFCAYKDYDWFMKSSKAVIFVFLFGRNGARVFYIVLGIILFFLGPMLLDT